MPATIRMLAQTKTTINQTGMLLLGKSGDGDGCGGGCGGGG
jgi:hypothetical protein